MDDKAQQETKFSNLPALASDEVTQPDASNKLVNPPGSQLPAAKWKIRHPLLASLAKTVGEVTKQLRTAQTGKAFVESAAEVGRQLQNRHTS